MTKTWRYTIEDAEDLHVFLSDKPNPKVAADHFAWSDMDNDEEFTLVETEQIEHDDGRVEVVATKKYEIYVEWMPDISIFEQKGA